MNNNVRPLANTSNAQIINSIKSALSPQFQARIPSATQGNMHDVVDSLRNFPLMRDEFFGVFVQKIIGAYVKHADWDNPLREIGAPKTLRQYGSVYEQAAIGLVEARTRNFNKEYLGDDVYGQYRVPAMTLYHPLTFDHYYPVTIPADALYTAFDTEDGLSNLVAELMSAPIKSDRNDMYLMQAQCFAEYARRGGYYRVHTDDVGAWTSTETEAKHLLRQIRVMSDTLRSTALSGMARYNAAGWVVPWDTTNAVLFATPEVIAALDVEALAQLFNIDKADVPYRIIPIPANMFGIKGVQAILTTTDFMFRWDEMLETTNSPVNPIDGSYNIFYKHRGSVTPNPLANAILFWTGEGTAETVSLPDSVTAGTPSFEIKLGKFGNEHTTPTNVTRGDMVQVVSKLSYVGGAQPYTVEPTGITYEITTTGVSQFTHIDNDGILVCGLDELNTSISVTAQATYINPATPEVEQSVSSDIVVPVVGDALPHGLNTGNVLSRRGFWVTSEYVGSGSGVSDIPFEPMFVGIGENTSSKRTRITFSKDLTTGDRVRLYIYPAFANADATFIQRVNTKVSSGFNDNATGSKLPPSVQDVTPSNIGVNGKAMYKVDAAEGVSNTAYVQYYNKTDPVMDEVPSGEITRKTSDGVDK